MIRKQLTDKFHRTRMIFREEEKLKKQERISRIYERKYPSRRLYREESMRDEGTGDCFLWSKKKMESVEPEIE